MRTVRLSSGNLVLGLAAGAALALAGAAFAQQKEHGERCGEHMQAGNMCTMNATHVATMCKTAKESLADTIKAAEKRCGGRAVQAECRYESGTGKMREGHPGVVCVVTLLVGDNRLVEATFNAEDGAFVNQRDVNMASFATMGGVNEFAMAERWQKATDLKDRKVISDSDEDLGRIEDIITDPDSGRILYGVLSFGGLLGLGEKYFAIPWPALHITGDAKAFVLNIDKDQLKNAPSFTPGQWPNFTDEQFANTIYKYYGLTPYWERGGVVRTTGETPGMTENYRMRWNERPVAWQKLSDLCGKEVGTAETENVGKLNDLAIDPDQGRILYGILSYGGKFFALPWATLTLTDDSQRFVLHTDKSQLNDEVAFTKDNWPNLTNPGYAMGTYEHYKVQPYWTAPLGEPTVRR